MKKFLLLLMFILGITGLGYAAETIDLGVSNSGWNGGSFSGSGYSSHTLTTDDYTVTISAGSKQTGTITDYPVVKASDIILTMKGNTTLKSVKVNFKQWTTKTQSAKIAYSTSTDGTNFTDISSVGTVALASNSWAISTGELPAGVVAVKATTTNGSNQVGVVSIEYELVPDGPKVFTGYNAADIEVMEGMTSTTSLITVAASELPKGFKAVSANTDVATVDDDYHVKGVAQGTTTITLSWDPDTEKDYADGSAVVKVNVTEKQKSDYQGFTTTAYTVKEGNTVDLVKGLKNLPNEIIFVSSNEGVATVSDAGVVTAVSAGTATITAAWDVDDNYNYNAGEAEFTITVEPKQVFNAYVKSLTLGVGGEGKIFTTETLPGEVTFTGYSGIISVDAAGKVTATAAGQTTINVSWSGTDDIAAGNATVVVTVAKVKTVDFDFVNKAYDMVRQNSGSTYINDNTPIATVGPVTLINQKNGGANGARLWADGIRCYNKSSIDVTVPEGYTITNVTGTFTDNSAFKIERVNDTKWTVSYTPTSSNKAIQTLKVEYIAPAQEFTGIKSKIGDTEKFMVGESTSIFTGDIKPATFTVTVKEGADNVEVSEAGIVKALAPGRATLSVNWEAFGDGDYKAGEKEISVIVSEFEHTDFTDYKSEVSVEELGTVNLFTVDDHTPIPAEELHFEYDNTYISIDDKGNVTAKGVSVPTVVEVKMTWAEDNLYKANTEGVTVKVTVNPKETFTGINTTLSMMTGGKANIFKDGALPEGLAGVKIVNNNDDVVEVNAETGDVTAKALGKATITVTWSNEGAYTAGEATVNITVNKGIDLGIANLPASINNTYGEQRIENDDYKLTFSNANKPATSSSINDVIVARADCEIVLQMKKEALRYVKFNFKQWGNNNRNATIYYSVDGDNYYEVYENSKVSIKGLTSLDTRDLCEQYPNDEIRYVKVTLGDGNSTSSTQVGVVSIEYETALPSFKGFVEEVKVTKHAEASLLNVAEGDNAPVITYTVEDETVATVDADGKVKGVAVGETTATLTWSENDSYRAGNATVKVIVEALPAFTGYKTELEAITVGKATTILTCEQEEKPEGITFSSDNTEVATVDEYGVIVGHKMGHAVITATWAEDMRYSAGTFKVGIDVNAAPAYQEHTIVMFNQADLAYAAGKQITLECYNEEHPLKFVSEATSTTAKYPKKVGDYLRVYNENELTISAPENYVFVSIKPNTRNGLHVDVNGVICGDEQKHEFDNDEAGAKTLVIKSSMGDGEDEYTDIESLEVAIQKEGSIPFTGYKTSVTVKELGEAEGFTTTRLPDDIEVGAIGDDSLIDAKIKTVEVEGKQVKQLVISAKANEYTEAKETTVQLMWTSDNRFAGGEGTIRVTVTPRAVFTGVAESITVMREHKGDIFTTTDIPATVGFKCSDYKYVVVKNEPIYSEVEEGETPEVIGTHYYVEGQGNTPEGTPATVEVAWKGDKNYKDGSVTVPVTVTPKRYFEACVKGAVSMMIGRQVAMIDLGDYKEMELEFPQVTFTTDDNNIKVEGSYVEGLAEGNAEVTASWAETLDFEAGEATVNVTVEPMSFTFDFKNNNYGMNRVTSVNSGNMKDKSITDTDAGIITIEFADANAALWNNDGMRLYAGASATIKVPMGYVISEVTVDRTGSTVWKDTKPEGDEINGQSYYKMQNTSANGTYAINTIKVVYRERVAVEFGGYESEIELVEGAQAEIINSTYKPEVKCTTTDTDIIDVTESGLITAIKPGEAIIHMTWAANEVFTAGEADITVTVKPLPDNFTATVVMKDQESLAYGKDKTIVWVSEQYNLKFNTWATVGEGWSQYPAKNGDNLRIYSSNGDKLYVEAPEGYYFASVKPVLSGNYHLVINECGDKCEHHYFAADEYATELVIESATGDGEGKNTDVASIDFELQRIPDVAEHDGAIYEYHNDGSKIYIAQQASYNGAFCTKHNDSKHVFKYYFEPHKNYTYYYKVEMNGVPAGGNEDEPEIQLMANSYAVASDLKKYEGEAIEIPANTHGTFTYQAVHNGIDGLATEAKTVAIDGATTGVEGVGVDADDSEVEYYTIQGVRVMNPTPGLYIVRRGSVVSKEIVR